MTPHQKQRLLTISQAGNAIAAEKGIRPSQVTGYEASMRAFGKKPGGDFYTLFSMWQDECNQPPGLPLATMSSESEKELENIFDHFKAKGMQEVKAIVGDIGKSYASASAIRVAGLEQRFADETRLKDEIARDFQNRDTELKLQAAENVKLRQIVKDLEDSNKQLEGRLLEAQHALRVTIGAAQMPKVSSEVVENNVTSDEAPVQHGPDTPKDVDVPPENTPL